MSIRGAIAGSVLLGQIVALVQLGKSAKESYYQRVFDGREPPLDTGPLDADPKNIDSGVVIHLAGGGIRCDPAKHGTRRTPSVFPHL